MRSFLNVAERRKRTVNILKREKSFRMGDHFSKIIKKVSFFFYLNMICALSTMPVIPKKLHQKSTQSNVIFIEQNMAQNRLKNCHLNEYEIGKLEHKPK